jgi:hypothetical protein
VDYLGYRLIALALCPLDRSTLILGSADAGRSIVSGTDEGSERKLLSLATHLNLKPHAVRGTLRFRMLCWQCVLYG